MKKYLLLLIALGLVVAPYAHAAISLVQHNASTSAGGDVTQEPLTVGSNVATNDLMVVTCSTFTTAPTNASDSVGNTYILAASSTNPTNGPSFTYTYYSILSSGGGTKITVACNGAMQQYFNTSYAEFSGVNTSNPIDVATGGSVNPAANSVFGITPATTTNANDLIYGSCTPEGLISGATSTYTQLDHTSDDVTDEYETVSSIAQYTTAFVDGGGGYQNDSCTAVAFKAAATTAPVVPATMNFLWVEDD